MWSRGITFEYLRDRIHRNVNLNLFGVCDYIPLCLAVISIEKFQNSSLYIYCHKITTAPITNRSWMVVFPKIKNYCYYSIPNYLIILLLQGLYSTPLRMLPPVLYDGSNRCGDSNVSTHVWYSLSSITHQLNTSSLGTAYFLIHLCAMELQPLDINLLSASHLSNYSEKCGSNY